MGTGVVSRDSTSLDKDRTKLRKGFEEDNVVDLQGEEELELVAGLASGRSEGHDELVLAAGLWWAAVMVVAAVGACD